MDIQDVIELISDYANKWTEQQNGSHSEIRLIDSRFANNALKVEAARTMYLEPTEQDMPDVKLDTQVFTNTSTQPKTVQFDMFGEYDTWQTWRIEGGATEAGNRRLDIEPLFRSEEVSSPLSLFLNDTLTLSGKTPFSVEGRDFTVRPRFKVTATLMAKPKTSTRAFDVKHDVTGYVELVTTLASGELQESLHNVGAIFQQYYSPYIEVNGGRVTFRDRGEYQSLDVNSIYIHIFAESLDIPGLTEEYNIYDGSGAKFENT
ncbi:hypothetical protein COL52_32215, partial [Bacillus toyonensis]|uniref:hypothetical protein n=1 Tax=Bacillus toyonensis TaxID=155322 RepID=UPI000BFB0EB8